MRLILIARVSDPEQQKALPAQKLKLKQYAARLNTEAEYYEFQESAHRETRQKFAKLVEHIKAQKEPVAVVFLKVDRFTRDQSQEEVRALNELVKSGRIELHFPDDGLIITKDSPATDLFRLSINLALAKYYSDTIRENVARRYAQMLQDGIWVGYAPLGYLNVNKGTASKPMKDIIIDPMRATHIVTMFKKRSTGMPYATIAQLVTEAGLISKTGKLITKSNVERIINNPFYAGTMIFMDKAYPHKYEPLVTKELYDLCQRARDDRHSNRTAYKIKPFVFNTFVRCTECKCMISSYIARNNTYLKCSKAKYKECKNVNTAEKLILPQVEAMLESIALSDEKLQKLINTVKEKHGNQQQLLTNTITETRQEYDNITAQLKTLTYERLESVKTGKGISTELFDEIVEELTNKQQALNSKLIKLTDYNKTYLTTASHLLDLGQRANELFKTSDNLHKQQILKGLVYNVEMFDQKLSYTLINCYEALRDINLKANNDINDDNWYPGRDSNPRP